MIDSRLAFQIGLGLLGPLLMWQILFRRARPDLHTVPGNAPRISVVVPARNEGHQIGRLLQSLECQSVTPHEVIVVDDNSSDDTASVGAAWGATVIQGQVLPDGWNGKSWACWQGARHSAGEILLFLDADTWLAEDGLAKLLNRYAGRRGLLSIQPYHVTQKHHEQLSAFFNIVLLAAVGAFTPLGTRIKPGGAFGPCMLCNREDYFRVGGHQAVKEHVLEDIPLGKRFLLHALPVRCGVGEGIISFRMYEGGFRELVEGWSKGVGYGAMAVHVPFTLATAAWITGCFSVCFTLLGEVGRLFTPAWWASLAIYCFYATQIYWMLRRIGRFKPWTSVLFPFPLCFFALIMVRSVLLTYVFRRVTWKGRILKS